MAPEGYRDLDLDEREELIEAEDAARERVKLADKGANYTMIRSLQPIGDPHDFGGMAFIYTFRFTEYFRKIMLFKSWQPVEGGLVQVRVNPRVLTDAYGYAVVRPDPDPEKELFIRVWNGNPNSVVIMPRRDTPLPRQGKEKEGILHQMHIAEENEISGYATWLERMKMVE